MNFEDIVGKSNSIREVLERVRRASGQSNTVLIQGEAGTGKDLIAKAIHVNSVRRHQKLVSVDCGSIQESRFEAELFGQGMGAASSSVPSPVGRLEEADGGTLFLKDIDKLPLICQAKLLRVIQDHQFVRVGDTRTNIVDIRIIATTSVDLSQMVEDGRFREDLYYRLNVMPIFLVPLRERREDIPLLVDHFISFWTQSTGRKISVSPSGLDALQRQQWPGNIRQLQNVIERALTLAQGQVELPIEYFLDGSEVNFSASLLGDSAISILFEPTLSSNQVAATLAALADYYRACGGVGLPVEFESQEAVTENAHV